MQEYFQYRFLADGTQVGSVLRKAVDQFSGDMSGEDAGTLELVLAEVLNNIVEHAFADKPPGPIEMTLLRQGATMKCQIEDHGRPMPGLQLPEGRMQSVDGDIQDLAEGGWGWALIRALTADLHYSRRCQVNKLNFCIPLNSG